MSKIYLIGVPPGNLLGKPERTLVANCGCVVATERYHKLATELNDDVLPLTPIQETFGTMEERLGTMDVAILASGDPLFFGIGRTLLNRFGRKRLQIIPALSAMQFGCGRFKEMWDDAVLLSFHGRRDDNLAARIMRHDKVFCFTDRTNSPTVIAQAIINTCRAIGDDELLDAYTIWVGENLGQEDEKITRAGLTEIAAGKFSDLNVMLLKRTARQESETLFGLQEKEISHSRGLITKDEIRATTLHQLQLPEQGVFWDVGAGSGSVALEAARLNPELAVFAVERHPDELANIRANCKKFEVHNITIIAGEAPQALTNLPDPNRVFVGGSGGNLAGIIETAAKRLKKDGRIVVNGVIEKTKKAAPSLLYDQGFKVGISEITIRRQKYPEEEKTTMNPIAIMVGER